MLPHALGVTVKDEYRVRPNLGLHPCRNPTYNLKGVLWTPGLVRPQLRVPAFQVTPTYEGGFELYGHSLGNSRRIIEAVSAHYYILHTENVLIQKRSLMRHSEVWFC